MRAAATVSNAVLWCCSATLLLLLCSSWGNRDDSPATLISESGKLRMLVQLLGKHREEGHRTLVFSQSKRMLDIIERVLEWKVCGSTAARSFRVAFLMMRCCCCVAAVEHEAAAN